MREDILTGVSHEHDRHSQGPGHHTQSRPGLLGIVPGSKVDFRRNEQGNIELVKASGEQLKSRFRRLLGHAGNGLTTDEIMQMTRGEE